MSLLPSPLISLLLTAAIEPGPSSVYASDEIDEFPKTGEAGQFSTLTAVCMSMGTKEGAGIHI